LQLALLQRTATAVPNLKILTCGHVLLKVNKQ
jgi:hypothetical protein